MSLTLLATAGLAEAANNPGTGDTGFFTFRPAVGANGTRVNVASGNLLTRTTDLAASTTNYHVVVDRAYNSLAAGSSLLGPGWTFDVGPETKVTVESNGDATVVGPTGYRVRFAEQPDGSYAAPQGFDGSLTHTVAGWTLTRSSVGDHFLYDSGGSLASTLDSAARAFTVTNTSAAGRTVLSSYGTTDGRRANFSYNSNDSQFVREFDDPASGHHYYTYASGHLTRYQGADGAQTTYTYDANGYLNAITAPNGDSVVLDNTSTGKVHSLAATPSGGSPQVTSFVYTRRPYKTDVTGPDSTRRTYAYDDDYRVTRSYDPDLAPTATAAGELFDLRDSYVGTGTYDLTVSADEDDGAGITHVAVEEVGGDELASSDPTCTDTAHDHVCPTSYTDDLAVDFSGVSEGLHHLQVVAEDDEGNVGTSEPWDIYVDHTAPAAAHDLDAAIDPDTGEVDVTWIPGDDPALPDGNPGSGADAFSYRYQINGGVWSAYETSQDAGFTLPSGTSGETVTVEITATDLVGNVGNATTLSDTAGSALDATVDDPGQPTGQSLDDIDFSTDPAPIDDYENDDAVEARGPITLAAAYHEHPCNDDDPCGTFSGKAAASYARYWYHRRNSRYRSFGNDCTNFVSQALKNGGMRFERSSGNNSATPTTQQFLDLFRTGTGSWWSARLPNSANGYFWHWTRSWTLADVSRDRIIDNGIGHNLSASEHLRAGDLVYYRFKNEDGEFPDQAWTHAAIVTRVTKQGVYVAQHTTDYERTLADVYARLAHEKGVRGVDWKVQAVRVTHTAYNIDD